MQLIFTILTEITNKLKSRVTIIAWIATTVLCALTGPFETHDLDILGNRLIFCGITIFAGIAYCLLCLHTMINVFPNLRPLYSKLIAISFFTITFSNAIYMMISMVYFIPKYPPIIQVYAVVGAISFSASATIYWLHIRPAEQREKTRKAFKQ